MSAPLVAEFRAQVRDRETLTFEPTAERTGAEPIFYRVQQAGELDHSVRWDDRPALNEKPQPAVLDWPTRPFVSGGYHFTASEHRTIKRAELFDLYHVDVGVYLLANNLLRLVQDRDPDSLSVAPARLKCADGEELYSLVMPRRVLDAVDSSKTHVSIKRPEVAKGRFVTHVHYDHGYTLRTNLSPNGHTFLERWRADWLWSEELMIAAALAGAHGFFGADTANDSYTNNFYVLRGNNKATLPPKWPSLSGTDRSTPPAQIAFLSGSAGTHPS